VSAARDPRLTEAKSKSVENVLSMLHISGLRRTPNKREFCGPCPSCGTAGHNPKSGPVDRFNINTSSGKFFCRKCGLRGGDVVALVQAARNCDFLEALTFLCGEKPIDETPKQRREREERQRAQQAELDRQEAERERQAAQYRSYAIRDAKGIWTRSRPGHLGVVRAYLTARGLGPDVLPELPQDLQFIVKHPYEKKIDGQQVTAHEGPCVITAIRQPNGTLSAVHQTWVDPTPPHGKARIRYNGEALPAKMVRGSKKGGAIRLHTPPQFDTLVMGEGIETTLTALAAWRSDFDPSRTAYWAGVDLGNMAGKMQRIKGKRYSGLPDMSDKDAFVPPPWIKRLIFIQDGDSDAKATRAKLESGLQRAMAFNSELTCKIVPAPEGADLNDVLLGAA
jgi:hypothetical protein